MVASYSFYADSCHLLDTQLYKIEDGIDFLNTYTTRLQTPIETESNTTQEYSFP